MHIQTSNMLHVAHPFPHLQLLEILEGKKCFKNCACRPGHKFHNYQQLMRSLGISTVKHALRFFVGNARGNTTEGGGEEVLASLIVWLFGFRLIIFYYSGGLHTKCNYILRSIRRIMCRCKNKRQNA